MRAGLIAAAAAAAMVVAAPASAATGTYAGTVGGDGKIALDVTIKRNHVVKFTQIRFVNVPMTCETSGPVHGDMQVTGSISIKSPSGKFAVKSFQEGFGNVSTVRGKVKHRKVAGLANLSYHYPAQEDPPYPEEDCTSGLVMFNATLGAPDETLAPPARLGR